MLVTGHVVTVIKVTTVAVEPSGTTGVVVTPMLEPTELETAGPLGIGLEASPVADETGLEPSGVSDGDGDDPSGVSDGTGTEASGVPVGAGVEASGVPEKTVLDPSPGPEGTIELPSGETDVAVAEH